MRILHKFFNYNILIINLYLNFIKFILLVINNNSIFNTCNPVLGRNMVNIISFLDGDFVVSPFLLALLSASNASTAVLLLFLI